MPAERAERSYDLALMFKRADGSDARGVALPDARPTARSYNQRRCNDTCSTF